jgi:peptidoglycan L-alanyl-D-glutamate endopeptidase CwlK
MSLLVNRIKAIQRAAGAEVDGVFGPVTALAVLRALQREDDAVGETPTLLDGRTAATLATLDAKAQARFECFAYYAQATAATLGCDYIAISGHRTWEEQDELYQRVPQVTRAKGGHSNHNFGIAVDFGVFQGGGRIYCDDSKPELARTVHAACAAHAKSCGLEWGGDWVGMKDHPHYELATGLSMAAKRKLYQKEGSVL